MNATNVRVVFEGDPNIEDSIALKQLGESLAESDIANKSDIHEKKIGVKDSGLTLALTIAGLALSAVGTLISAISLWASKRNYSISFQTGGATFAANNLSAKETLSIAQVIKDKAVASDVKVLVSRR